MEEFTILQTLLKEALSSTYASERLLQETIVLLEGRIQSKKLRKFLGIELKHSRNQQYRLEGVFALLNTTPDGANGSNEVVAHACNLLKSLPADMPEETIHQSVLLNLNRTITLDLTNRYQTLVTYAEGLNQQRILPRLRRSVLAEKEIDNLLRNLEESNAAATHEP
jgi:ferritin-like metal-binding protein YciE